MREEIVGIDTPTHTLATSIVHAGIDTQTASGVRTGTDTRTGTDIHADTDVHPDTGADSKRPKAVIVMFAGSGPIDRNENLPNFSLNIFNTLAESFAAAGFSSVRYDKRGCGASGGDYMTAGHSDFVADAVSVTNYVMAHEQLRHLPLILLGHSEGAAIAPQVAQSMDIDTNIDTHKSGRVQGLILLCPFARPMREVLQQQAINRSDELQAMKGFGGSLSRSIVWLRGGYTGIQTKFLKRVEQSSTDTVSVGKATLNAKWYREMLALDIKTLLASIETPTFALGGGKDAQCDPLDTEALSDIITKAPVTTHIEQHLTHILRCDDQPSATGRYPTLVKKPIDGLVAERCVHWLENLLK